MNKQRAVLVSAVVGVVIGLVILASAPEIEGANALGTPLFCKDSGTCPAGPLPYAYILSLPVGSPILNETQLLQSIPAALYVSKFVEADDSWLRWDGSECCTASKLKAGVTPFNCHSTVPGGCFSVTPGEAHGVVVSVPSRYNVDGSDGTTTISLESPTPGVSRTGKNLVALPYCSPVTDARALMASIGGGSIVPVASVSRYLSSSNTFEVYTGRMGSPVQNFAVAPGEGYLVTMNASVSYPTTLGPCLPSVAPCTGCGPDGTPCDDGSFCTTSSECFNGACVVGAVTSCDDGRPATVDFCDGCTGACVNYSDPCVNVESAGGTITLPPAGCKYVSPEALHQLIEGLPVGTEIIMNASHQGFFPTTPLTASRRTSTLSTTETFDSDLVMHLTGTGTLAGLDCDVTLSPLHAVVESQPTQPNQAVQDFNTDMRSLTGGPVTNDPCNLFQSLSVMAGTVHGLPSPGHVHLQRLSDGSYDVASFFDVNVTMAFVGEPGGPLDGMSGSTTQIVRMGPATNVVGGVGVVITAVPQEQDRTVGGSHTVSAVVSDNAGNSLVGRSVSFTVMSGPNAGVAGTCSPNPSCVTDVNGRVSFSYASNGVAGTDTIGVCPAGGSCLSPPLTVDWMAPCTPSSEVDDGVRLAKSGGVVDISWNAALNSTTSDIIRGALSGLPVGPGGGDEACLADDVGGTLFTDPADPAVHTGFWYLIRGGGACGSGPLGFQGIGGVPTSARVTTTCP